VEVRVLHRALDVVGGAEVLLVDQARSLQRAGANVSLRTLVYSPGSWNERVGPLGVEALHRVTDAERRPRIGRDPGPKQLDWLLGRLGGIDLVIAHGYPVSCALGAISGPGVRLWYCHEAPRWLHPREANPYLAKHAARAPERHGPKRYTTYLASSFGALPLVGRRRPSIVEADRRGVSGLDAIWANSEYTRDAAQRIYGKRDCAVVYPFVDFPAAPPARSGVSRDGLRILCVSRLEWVKNLDTLLEGFARFRKADDGRATLDIVGTGSILPLLRSLTAELGLVDAVKFHGFLPDAELARLSARSDVFACLPLDEPFGMIFPEAIGRGLLVLGPDHGGPAEILEHGRLGEVVDPLDPEAIAAGLARLQRLSSTDADRRRQAADLACRQRFSAEVVGARMLSLLAEHGLHPSARAVSSSSAGG
jgi:glycosyltransferase involved in cell wall biosynthesis